MSNQTVSEKALLLAAEARRIGVSQSAEEATVAVTTRIKALRERLQSLRTVVPHVGSTPMARRSHWKRSTMVSPSFVSGRETVCRHRKP
jgi:hypothetical protein